MQRSNIPLSSPPSKKESNKNRKRLIIVIFHLSNQKYIYTHLYSTLVRNNIKRYISKITLNNRIKNQHQPLCEKNTSIKIIFLYLCKFIWKTHNIFVIIESFKIIHHIYT